jgi:hypothetical protein
MEVINLDKLYKVRLFVFSNIILIGLISYIFHLLPYSAVWLWFPIIVFLNHWLNWYAKKRGLILSDEMTKQRGVIASWWTFQSTIVIIFLLIVYYDLYRTLVDPRYILAYLAGFMGIVYLFVYIYFNIKQGIWE